MMTIMSGQFDGLPWRKSSRSNGNGGNNCTMVAVGVDAVGVKDSKDPEGPVLAFTLAAWAGFVAQARLGRFDLPAG